VPPPGTARQVGAVTSSARLFPSHTGLGRFCVVSFFCPCRLAMVFTLELVDTKEIASGLLPA